MTPLSDSYGSSAPCRSLKKPRRANPIEHPETEKETEARRKKNARLEIRDRQLRQ